MDAVKQKIKVLIVDDDECLRGALAFALARRNFLVEEVENGKKALEHVSRNKPDVILLDAVMPVMDGFEACRQLRKNPATQFIPIIFCTATHVAAAKKEGIEVDEYIEKPFLLEELCKKIYRLLKVNLD